MRFSKLFVPTMKETPGEADVVSHQLMVRAGLIRKLASGIYEWLPVGYRVLKKVERIITEEMDAIGGQEVWLPALLPRALWDETGRWALYGKELMRIKDRHGREFALAPTHEEAITDIVRKNVRSYKQLPLLLYQLQTKFRDEVRPRFGVMRAREFYMKDAYSFHADEEDARKWYKKIFDAYKRIFERCGFKFQAVEALTGAIGGQYSHEFMVLAETGEEGVVSCPCGYAANVEKAAINYSQEKKPDTQELPLEEVHTPDQRTVGEVGKFLQALPVQFIKSLIYLSDGKPVMALMRGDGEIEEQKLKEVLGSNELMLADSDTIRKVTGAPVGFAGPVTAGAREGKGKKTENLISIVADTSVTYIVNGISGANKKDYHLKNINIGRDYTPDTFADIRKVKPGDICIRCGKKLDFCRGIEVGHTFMLGKKYSHALHATFLDAQGREQEYVMGCYGIGVSRIVAASIEQNNDNDGIIWPIPIAPFHVIIVPINYEEPDTKKAADALYADLQKTGIEVVLDDRPDRAGVKFKDADLIGIPLRLTVSDKKLKTNKIELKLRSEKTIRDIPISSVVDEVRKIINKYYPGTVPR